MMLYSSGKKYQGFTLIETIVSMFIFVLVIAAVAQIFTQAFSGYRYGKIVQKDLESAQFAINIMAKELRTSSIVNSSSTSIKFYDHSQGICFQYQISGTNLEAAQSTASDVPACNGMTLSSYTTVARSVTGGTFVVTQSADTTPGPQVVGKVTVSLQIGAGVSNHANIQTSLSLRDYGNAGL